MERHVIAVLTKSGEHYDPWGLPVEGALDIIDIDVVLTRFDEDNEWNGTGYFTNIEFGVFSLYLYPIVDNDHYVTDWENTDYQMKRYFQDDKPIKLADLRHQIRTRYLEASGDTDPTPTSKHDAYGIIRHDLTIFDGPEEIRRVTLQRWPNIDPSFISEKVES